jgi:hypothetical protein
VKDERAALELPFTKKQALLIESDLLGRFIYVEEKTPLVPPLQVVQMPATGVPDVRPSQNQPVKHAGRIC